MIGAVQKPEAPVFDRLPPRVIQGGMGMAVSSWRLARSVSRAGQLGVVSGIALDTVLARRLQDGDPEGDIRRALDRFPIPAVAESIRSRYFLAGGRPAGKAYAPVPKLSFRPTRAQQELTVVGNFVEVWLAKEGHSGLIGVNYMEKVQLATPAAVLGAMLAEVDCVLMGAGVPREIPRLLDDLAAGSTGTISVDVHGSAEAHRISVDAHELLGDVAPRLRRPAFLAIVSAHVLAYYLARDEGIRPDGFVIEGHAAGGHSAPPRGPLTLDEDRQPIYGPRDDADIAKIAALGLPFWLAGGYGHPDRLAAALAAGATGVQVGTLFALSRESGLREDLREGVMSRLDEGTLEVRADASASPTGFPFKVAQLDGTLSEPAVYASRERLCDLSYLREPFAKSDGGIGFRCASEPVPLYVRKGGDAADTVGRVCLCNALTAAVGLGQSRRDDVQEPALVTLGQDLDGLAALRARHPGGWRAEDVVSWLLEAPIPPSA